jgi:DNA polymerase-3 subunit alpha
MCVFTLEDTTASLETVVFPETFGRFGHLADADAMIVVRGKFEKDDESARLVATEMMPVSALRERLAREVAIRLSMPPHGRETLEALAELLGRHRGDRRLCIELETEAGGRTVRVKADVGQMRVRPSERLVADVERLCGSGSITLR